MKRFTSLAIMMAIVIGLLPVHAAGDSQRWQAVKTQCEEQGLQVTWYPEYEGLMRRYGTGQMLLVEGGKSYLCKLNGSVKLAGPFDAFGEFNKDGLASACQNGRWGMVDMNGSTVVDFLYDAKAKAEAVGEFAPNYWESADEDALHEGLRRVQTGENGLWAFVNEAGETVIPALFDAVGYFDCGYASVLVDGVFGLLRNPLLTEGKTEASTAAVTFADVPAGSWFENGVMTCAKSGVMVGVGENVFSPNATLTDAECAMLAYRIYDQAHGGDGSLMKMPEGYGYIKLVSEDGNYVHAGYAGDGNVWGREMVFYNSHGYRLRPYGEVRLGPATVTFGGKEYRGEVKDGSRGSGRYPSDHFPYFEPEDSTFNDLIMKAYRIPPPDRWWANLVYTIWEKGWEDIFPYIIYGHEAYRYSFAELLGNVTNLPKRFDVPPIPDGGERGVGTYNDQVYELYEAGIIGGVDAYGTFEPEKTLTRAEAAVMVARVLDESQRLTTPPKPMPTAGEGYTLTYLRDGMFADLYRLNDTYPYCVVGETVEGSTYVAPVGLLTLEGEYTPWAEELEKQVKVPYGWRDWGGLWTGNRNYYRWSDGTPATEKFDCCGKIGPDGRGFVQKDGKLYRIQFDLTAEKAVLRPERPTVPPDAAEGTEYLYDFLFRERYGAKVEQTYTFSAWDEERKTADYYTLLMPVEGALEGAVAESIDGDGMTPYQLKRYKQDGPNGSLVVGVHAYPLDEVEYISYLWTDRPEVWTDWYVGVGVSEEDLLWSYWGRANLRLIEKEEAELDWMSSHSTWDFDELYVWQPYTPENNDVRDITFYMKDRKVAAVEMTEPYELRYVYGHDVDEEIQRADQRRQGY